MRHIGRKVHNAQPQSTTLDPRLFMPFPTEPVPPPILVAPLVSIFDLRKPQKKDELCLTCDYTYDAHIGNTGCLYPCWSPSGRYKGAKR